MMNKRRKASWVMFLATGMLAAGALADSVWINSDLVQIRSGKGAVFPVIATASKGTELTVVDREGHWIKVQVNDQQGYVFDGSTSPQKVSGGGNLLASMGAGADASNMSSGAAAKGLAPDADQWAASKNIDPGPMNRLIAFRKQIDPQLWVKFTQEGKVGPDAPGAQ
jgi:hypothetical protein